MTIEEAKAYITWFRNNHLPEGAGFVQTNTGRQIMLDKLNDEDVLFVAISFEAMLIAAMENKAKGEL